MKNLKSFIVIAVCSIVGHFSVSSQGCVAIRGSSSCGSNVGNALNLTKGEFNTQLGFRHFKSFRHFRGDVEEVHRIEEGTEVVNNSSFLDFGLSYGITDRLYANVIVPFVYHARSSMYEHGGNPSRGGLGERHETTSYGLSDVRLSIGYWLFDPEKHDFNYAVGLGVKLPTGKYDYKDTFYNQGDNRDQDVEAVVDQSIQPGDGGTGLTLDFQGFHPLSHHFALSTNFYYLFNFYETNGVLTRNGRSEFSCADQFAAQLGANYSLMNGLGFYLGARVEGVPAYDAIGSSAGYRRPGFAISAEPGIGYFKSSFSIFMSVPLAVYRNRTRSYEDRERTAQTGDFSHGDAAFADYLINVGISYRFGGKSSMIDMEPHEEGYVH